jgi:hypothetical protein
MDSPEFKVTDLIVAFGMASGARASDVPGGSETRLC